MEYMKTHNGFTLIELLTVIAITVILIGLVVGVASRIDTQNKERLLQATFANLETALRQFADSGYQYDLSRLSNQEMDFYNSHEYPPDCNDYSVTDLRNEIAPLLGVNLANVTIEPWDAYENEYSGCAAMCFFLNRVPESRQILSEMNPQFLTNEDRNGKKINIYIGIGSQQRAYPLIRVLDPWGKTLRYDYYMSYQDFSRISSGTLTDYYEFVTENKETFPVLSSAGPDGEWNTGDDITSR